jgi:hypothetical protein
MNAVETEALSLHLPGPPVVAGLVVLFGVLGIPFSTGLYWRLSRLRYVWSLLLGIGTALTSAGVFLWHAIPFGRALRQGQENWEMIREDIQSVTPVLCTGLFVLTVAPFAVMLYRKWTGATLRDAERREGDGGIRAWLSPGNLVLAILVAVFAWLGFGYPLPLMLACTIGALLAFPLFNMAAVRPEGFASAASETQEESKKSAERADEAMSAEQAKVLALLEEGKISAQESAELLNALSETRREGPGKGQPLSTGRKLLAAGAAVVLVGFLLPWFRIDLAEEMGRMQEQLQQSLSEGLGLQGPPPGGFKMNVTPSGNGLSLGNTTNVHGGDVGRGLGWLVLILASVAALAPFAGMSLTPQARWGVMMGALTVGAVILLYLLTQSARYITYGYVIVLIGYALSLAGAVKERPEVRAG